MIVHRVERNILVRMYVVMRCFLLGHKRPQMADTEFKQLSQFRCVRCKDWITGLSGYRR